MSPRSSSKTSSTLPLPFAEIPWLVEHPSPYYDDSHRQLQQTCFSFCSEHIHPHATEYEDAEEVPQTLYKTFANAGMLVPNLPTPLPIEWLNRVGIKELPGGVMPQQWNYFHTAVYLSEMMRSGLQGPHAAITTGFAFGIPPIYKFGSQDLQMRLLPDLLLGRKRVCIAITEPDAGSDVAGIKTTARLSKDGKNYIVNGAKKWITNGIWSDFATMAVRTGGSGPGGLSMLIVPLKNYPGVTMRRLHVQGQRSAGTTYIELDDVVVPVENLIGEEGMGMKYIMTNFNHERLFISISVTAQARVALSTALSHTLNRKAFGKRLIDQPVVRHRLAKCAAEVESQWAWVETLLYQMSKLDKAEADAKLGGLTALAKARAGIVLNECAQCAVLLFGGMGFTRSGKGEIAERMYREVMGARIPGGSEDVMLDLAIRQAVKRYEALSLQNEHGLQADTGLERPKGDAKL